MSKNQNLPEDGKEFDYQHCNTFKKSLPWWFRPVHQTLKQYSVEDFVVDVRQRLEQSIAETNTDMARIFRDRRVFAQAFSYRIARETAAFAKTGYGQEMCKDFLHGTVQMMHKTKRFAIPQGDPLYGKYGFLSTEHRTKQTISLCDLTTPEKKLVDWLRKPETIDSVFQHENMHKYMQRQSSVGYVLYAPDVRKKIWNIVEAQHSDDFDAQWREECVQLCIDEMVKVGQEKQQLAVDTLIQDEDSGEILLQNASEVIEKYILPNMNDKTSAVRCCALLEQMFAVAAEEKDVERIAMLVQTWNTIVERYSIAPNERPTGGLAGLTIKCAVEYREGVKEFLGPVETNTLSS